MILRLIGAVLADMFFSPVLAVISIGLTVWYGTHGDDSAATVYAFAGFSEWVGWRVRSRLAERDG